MHSVRRHELGDAAAVLNAHLVRCIPCGDMSWECVGRDYGYPSGGCIPHGDMSWESMVRVVIQHFSKNTVISMVLGHPNSEITCIPPS